MLKRTPRLPPEVAAVVKEWLQHHGNEECSADDKRLLAKKMLMHQSVRDLKKTPEQMLTMVSNTLQKLRPSIAPQKANKGRNKSVVGGETAHSSGRKKAYNAAHRGHLAEKHKTWQTTNRDHVNAKQKTWRAANRDTYNAKQKTWRAANRDTVNAKAAARRAADRHKRHEAARAWMAKKGYADQLLNTAAVKAECQRILFTPLSEFKNRTLWALMHDQDTDFAAYVGFTQRLKVEHEAYGFLGTRGSRRGDGQRNRHILARGRADFSTKRHFTPREAQKELDMQFVVVYESTVKVNAYAVEAALQHALRKIQLGRRLWRWEAMGQPEPDTMPDKLLYKVFITFSFVVQAAIKAQKCIVQL